MQSRAVHELVRDAGLLVVAQCEVKSGEVEKVADILGRSLPHVLSEPGVKLFLIGRDRDNPAEFLFDELFANEAAFAAHQASEHFKTMIAGEAPLPPLAKRQRTQYALL